MRLLSRFVGVLLLLLTLSINSVSSEQITQETSHNKSQRHEQTKLVEETSIDLLLGPEDNFPFRPENHRDNSSPIARIGSISDKNI